jgi:hypothetical protein
MDFQIRSIRHHSSKEHHQFSKTATLDYKNNVKCGKYSHLNFANFVYTSIYALQSDNQISNVMKMC